MKKYNINRCNVMVKVRGDSKDDLLVALAEFNSKMKKSEVLNDYRKHEHYRSPSEKRKWKKSEAIRRLRRESSKLLKNLKYNS